MDADTVRLWRLELNKRQYQHNKARRVRHREQIRQKRIHARRQRRGWFRYMD